ncbi:MAG TPA: MerR family transcriptional regulator [Streptosporangiaceae bacterium]|jgi:DNA-binding transcriptional MerR regulator
MPSMNLRLAIGDFARMTHLSVKALRHYHDVGVLAPAEIDPGSGYRFYDLSQVPLAQVIRRFRDLGMPLDEVKAVLQAPDVASRNEVIVTHLARMESQLAQTQSMVASLRSLLEKPPRTAVAVEHRSVPATPALAITERVAEAAMQQWWAGAFEELYGTLRSAGVAPAGPSGSLYSGDLFETEVGEVVAFVPVPCPVAADGRPSMLEVPPAELAVALHKGSFGDLDQTYAPLGAYVSERELGVEGPIREYYLVSPADTEDESLHRTEVGWPIFRTSAA